MLREVSDILRIAIGPTLSLIFFFIGYRRTVGARKERAHAAEMEIERLMLRRVIVDGYTPSWDDLARLIARKARQHRVKVTDLASEAQLLTGVYIDVLENEFVAHNDREALLKKLDGVLQAREAEEQADHTPDVDAALDYADRAEVDRQRQRGLAAIATLAAAAGTAAAAAANTGDATPRSRELVLTVAVISSLLVALAAVVVRLRERLEDEPRSRVDAPAFEAKVEQELARAGFAVVAPDDASTTVDFVVRAGGRNIAIDVTPVGRASSEYVKTIMRRTQQSAVGYDELLLVIPTVPSSLRNWHSLNMRVVDLRGLRAYLKGLDEGPAAAA